MELMEAIKERRSVRKFTEEKVGQDKIEKLLDAAIWAPSGQNLQPWYFVVLTKPEDLSKLFAAMGHSAFSQRKELEARFQNHPEIVEETMEFMSAMGGASTIILAFLNKPKYDDDQYLSCVESVAAAMQNIVLKAHEEGLATCWVEGVVHSRAEIEQEFAPEHGQLIGAVVVGYAAQEPRAPKRKDGRIEIR